MATVVVVDNATGKVVSLVESSAGFCGACQDAHEHDPVVLEELLQEYPVGQGQTAYFVEDGKPTPTTKHIRQHDETYQLPEPPPASQEETGLKDLSALIASGKATPKDICRFLTITHHLAT